MDIVIVEDSATQALYLKGILSKNHYSSIIFSSGTDALKSIFEISPKIVISDVVMPGMDGYELTEKIKAQSNLPVILMTELSDPKDILRGLKSGADNFLTKPIDENLLLSRIKYVLTNSELRKNSMSGLNFELYFSGVKYSLNSDRLQILDLLLSTYEISFQQKSELKILNEKLSESLTKIKKLEGILPICAKCKKIRDDKGYWGQVEAYIQERSEAEFSHSICPNCAEEYHNELRKLNLPNDPASK